MRITINQIKEKKQRGEKITMLTAYDYATAKLVDEALQNSRRVNT